jgi:hypothetical protein
VSESFDSNVTLTIELGFGSGPLASSPSWTDISAYGRQIEIRRGRSSIDQTFPAGTATVVLDNRDGRFDPNNSSSPYSPNVEIGVPVRITATYSATPYVQFYGHVGSWPLSYPEAGKDAVVALECIENLGLLSQYDLVDDTYSAEITGTRVGNVLDDAGWPAGARSIDTGIASVAAWSWDDSGSSGTELFETISESALQHLQRVEQAEQGSLFVARTGDLTFYERTQFSGTPASTGTYGPGNLEYADVMLAYDDDLLFNRAAITTGDTTMLAEDATSITDHGPRTYWATNELLTANEALNVAEWVVLRHKDMHVRVTGMVVRPQFDPSNLWPEILAMDLRDAITVNVDPPGAGTDLSQLVTVEGISHSIGLKTWTTVLTCHPLSDAETDDYWILGTSELGTETILA